MLAAAWDGTIPSESQPMATSKQIYQTGKYKTMILLAPGACVLFFHTHQRKVVLTPTSILDSITDTRDPKVTAILSAPLPVPRYLQLVSSHHYGRHSRRRTREEASARVLQNPCFEAKCCSGTRLQANLPTLASEVLEHASTTAGPRARPRITRFSSRTHLS